MNQITVTLENDEIIAHVFIDEDGTPKAIVKDGFKVIVEGEELEKTPNI